MPELPAPAVLPVFPLTGSLLLPGSYLPLNIFEERYRNMVADAMAAEKPYIGMIQPLLPAPDNWPNLFPPAENPELYQVGCAGYLERCERQEDGRYLILLKGVCRFRIREELPLLRRYRRVVADYEDYMADAGELSVPIDPRRLLAAVEAFSKAHNLEFDLDLLADVPGVSLVNGLTVALPFRPAEKQALLEAADPVEREEMLLSLMGMGLDFKNPSELFTPPTLH